MTKAVTKDNVLSLSKETKKTKNDQKLFAWMTCTIGQQTGIEIVRWWNSEAEKIVVPEQHEGKPVLRIGDSAFKDHRIQRIILPATLKEIGNSAFFGCKELSGIIIPPSVTSIGENAFAQCSGMKKIVLSHGLEFLGVQAFSYSGVRKISRER